MKTNTIEIIKFAVAVAVVSVAAALWFPGVAQEKVNTQVTVQEKIDSKQTGDIEILDNKVDKLVTAQAVANAKLEAATAKMEENNQKIEKLITAIRRGRVR